MIQSHSATEGTNASLHRCFYALTFDQSMVDYLARIIAELKRHDADVRWVRPENLHLTLRFLGEITDEQLEEAKQLPEDIHLPGALHLGARGLGAFPSLRNASVLWAGVQGRDEKDMERLLSIQGETEQWARKLGLKPEQRRYSPHITLGRVRRAGAGLRPLVNDITVRECESPFSEIGEVVLMRSVLGREGARYEVMG